MKHTTGTSIKNRITPNISKL